MSLNHNGSKGALLAMIHLQDADRGYSETVNFTNPVGKTNERHGAGLRLGSVNNDPLKPLIAVRNLGDSATTVKAIVPYSKQNGDTGTITLPQVSLAPGEIKLLNTSNPQLRRNDFDTAGIEIKYTGAPGSLIASASSVSQSGNYVFALPVKDPQGGLSSTGGYPWFIGVSSSTVVFIKNTTNEPRTFALDLVYASGQWGSGLKTIAPGQTFKLDVREVRDSQMKGSAGNAVPLDAVSGHVNWSVRGKGGNKTLIGRAQTVDLSNGLASTYECQQCCQRNFYDSRLEPGIVSGFPGDQQQFLPVERTQDCYGNIWDWDGPFATVLFSSDNYGVASINGIGLGTAIAPGSTTLRASWDSVRYFKDPNGSCLEEPAPTECTSFCDVAPRVTISGPNKLWWFFNENPMNYPTSITLTATVDPPNATSYSWVISQGTAQVRFDNNGTSMTTSSNTVVVKSINSSGVPNDISIKVTVMGRQSPEFKLTSLTPYRLNFMGHQPNPHDTRGYFSVLTYQILDQFGTKLKDTVPAAMAFNEKFTSDVVNDYPGANWTFPPPSGTSKDPNFMEDFIAPPEPYSGRNPTPTAPGFVLLGDVKVQHRTQEWYVGSEVPGKGRHVQINVIQFYLDHGNHLNTQSPPPNQCGNPPCN